MSAGALFLDEERRILVVKPTYRAGWLVPGGVVEPHESPLAACLREVREELALEAQGDRLLCVEYESTDGGYIERINFVFFGGVLSAAQLQTIRIDGCEIEEYRLVSHAEAMAKLNPPLARRIALALRALRQGGTVYAEDGTEVRTRDHNPRRLIRAEYPTEHAASEAIHEAAFGRKLEADVVRRLHQSGDVAVLSLVAERAGRVVGHAMFSYAGLEGSDETIRRVVLLAPLAVQPGMQGRGIGTALVRQGIERLEARGEPVMIVRGDLQYYGRFGFRPAADLDIIAPFAVARDHYLAKPLRAYEPSYRGVVRYPAPFGAVGYPIEWTDG